MNTATISTTAIVAHFVLTLANSLRLADINGVKVTIARGSAVKYGTLRDGLVGLRLADGRGVKVTADEWRRALASGESVDGYREAAYVLRVKSEDARKQRNAVHARLSALGYTKTCGRCGGGGQYSYCRDYGTKCFDCGGCGKVAMRITHDVLSDVENRVNAGELDAYLARLNERGEALRAIKPLWRTMEAEESASRICQMYEAQPRGWDIGESDVWGRVLTRAPLFRARHMQCDLHDLAFKVWLDFDLGKRTDYTAIVAELSAIRDALRALDAAWSEYVASGADVLTPTRE
jgi:hypothetical protein